MLTALRHPRVRPWLWVALAAAVGVHLYGLYAPAEPGAVGWFPNADKVLHCLGFAVPATLAVMLVKHWWPLAVFAAHALASEMVQARVLPSRDGDPLDVIADLTGVLMALAFWCWLQRRASATSASKPTSRTSAAARRPNA